MLYGLLNDPLGNLIKDYPARGILIYPKHLSKMPGYGLSFPIRVGCQHNVICGLRFLTNALNDVSPAP